MGTLVKIKDEVIDNPHEVYQSYMISTFLSREEMECYQRIHMHYGHSFEMIKAKNTTGASQHLIDGDLLFRNASPSVKLMATIFALPFISYYYYKINDFQEAINKTELIISSMLPLEETDHEYLFFSRMQQQQNLGRIYWSTEDITASIKMYSKCTLDIYSKTGNWKTTQVINHVPVISIVETTQYLFLIQVLTEIFNRLIYKFKNEKDILISCLQIFLDPLPHLNFSRLNPDDLRYSGFDSYLFIFSQLAKKNEDLFVEHAAAFIDNNLYDKEMRKIVGRYLYHLDYL